MTKKKLEILTLNTSLKINDMIARSEGKKREILLELKKLNADAYKFMTTPNARYSSKYTLLQKEECWKQAKKLLLEYFDYDVKCKVCGKKLDGHDCVMHHVEYHIIELFCPGFVSFVHDKCHELISIKNKKEKEED